MRDCFSVQRAGEEDGWLAHVNEPDARDDGHPRAGQQ
jgi:hypothetical protein